MKFYKGQVLVEYILLSLLVGVTTVAVVKFIVYDVFKGSMGNLNKKTTECVSSNTKDGNCK